MAVITIVETREYMDRGKVCHYTFTEHIGLAIYTDKDKNDGEPFWAEKAVFKDYGKQGVTRTYTIPGEPATDEEKARNLERIEQAVNVAMHRRGATDYFTVSIAPSSEPTCADSA